MSNQEKVQEEGLIDLTEYITDYLRVIRHMWNWFLIFAVLFAGVFYVRARLNYSPRYTASATFTVNMRADSSTTSSSSVAFFNNDTAEQMAKTFPYILTSGVLKRMIEEDMGAAATTSSISVDVLDGTNLLTISVTDRDAGRAYAVLQSVIENYPTISEVIVGKTYMELLDETGIPPYADNPMDFKADALKGAILGAAIAAAWSLMVCFTRKTVRKEEDVNKRIHTKCLGTIPFIPVKRRSQMTEEPRLLVTDPRYEEALQENLRMIRNKIEYYAHEYQHRSFVITSAAAGEGKSTVSVNLALTLARTGHKVVLIDCDLRNPSDAKTLGVETEMGLSDVLEGKCQMSDVMLNAEKVGVDGDLDFYLLPGGEPMEDGSELLGSELMLDVIESVESWADYVILDSAPAGLITDAVVLAQYADAALFVVRKDYAKVDHILDGMEHLAECYIPIIGCVLNGV